MRAFRTFLGHSDMMAYLAMMAPRLIELRRVLKVTGSIHLHCYPTQGQAEFETMPEEQMYNRMQV